MEVSVKPSEDGVEIELQHEDAAEAPAKDVLHEMFELECKISVNGRAGGATGGSIGEEAHG